MRRLLPLLVAAALVAPGAARAQLNQLPPAQPQTQPTVVVTNSSTSSGGGLTSWQQALIFGAGAVLLLGIGWAIVSDARDRAPVSEGESGTGSAVTRAQARARRHQRERARAKAARAARRRNR
jgi:hypothetical protein